MHWALETAQKIIERYPDKEEYVIASGVSPSGYIHIGNFREIVTTYFVGEALKKLGKKVRFILSFDDFDRFRKVPSGIPSSYEKYIGMPYTAIPSHLTEGLTYAQEMENRFVGELNRLGINPEIISQTEQYKSGRYREKIMLAMEKRKVIFDILAKYKTQKFDDNDRNNYYPISLYCDCCGKDSTTILSYNEESGDIKYKCACGNIQIININEYNNIKLQWKIDWPMRWQQENVIFEPGGRDHSADNGSYVVSREIAKELFDYEAPIYVAYDFIGIKGANGKMASSSGNVLTLTDLLSVYDPHIILWFYAKYEPKQAFNLALDNDVLRYYSEFDRIVRGYFDGKLTSKNLMEVALTNVTESYKNNPDFGNIAKLFPIVNYDVEVLKAVLAKAGIDCNNNYFLSRLTRARKFLEIGNNDQQTVLDGFNKEYYDTLTDQEKEWMKKTLDILAGDYNSVTELQNKLYEVPNDGNTLARELKKIQRRYFTIIYNLLLGTDAGPKIGLLLSAIPYDVIESKLLSAKDRDSGTYVLSKNC